MATTSQNRTGIFIVRLWLEDQGEDRFRARISHTLDSMLHDQTSAIAGNPEDLYAAVRTWVDAFIESS